MQAELLVCLIHLLLFNKENHSSLNVCAYLGMPTHVHTDIHNPQNADRYHVHRHHS